MKAKKQKTFAQRAERIMKKYEARPDDTAAQDSKNRELAVLKQEQEMYKQNKAMEAMETIQSMGYGEMLASNEPQQDPPQQGQEQMMQQGQPSQEEMMAMQQQQNGPMHQMPDGSMMPGEQHGQQMAAYGGNINRYVGGGDLIDSGLQRFYNDYSNVDLNELTSKADPNNDLGNEMNPYAALAQGAGDAYGLAKSFQKYDPRTAETLDYQRTNTTAQENAIDRATASAQMGAREGLRNMGPAGGKAALTNLYASSGATAGGQKANVIAGAQQLDDRTNLSIDQYNIGQETQADESNRGAKDAKTMAQVQHMQNLGQTYAGYDKDTRANQYQNDVLNMMDTDNYEYIKDENGNLMAVPKYT